jgi:hypothetical protein
MKKKFLRKNDKYLINSMGVCMDTLIEFSYKHVPDLVCPGSSVGRAQH